MVTLAALDALGQKNKKSEKKPEKYTQNPKKPEITPKCPINPNVSKFREVMISKAQFDTE